MTGASGPAARLDYDERFIHLRVIEAEGATPVSPGTLLPSAQ
ncbi:hypothetical protein [Streptomyces tailanensis]|nr:hypothetical protein [Streptomyces tailanensis]